MNKVKYVTRVASLVGVAIAFVVGASLASAQAQLSTTVPSADSTGASPKVILVHFNEAVAAKMSSVTLAASDGTAVAAMAMNDAKDSTTLSIMPSTPLKAGRYRVSWSAVTDDGQKTQGSFSFTVE